MTLPARNGSPGQMISPRQHCPLTVVGLTGVGSALRCSNDEAQAIVSANRPARGVYSHKPSARQRTEAMDIQRIDTSDCHVARTDEIDDVGSERKEPVSSGSLSQPPLRAAMDGFLQSVERQAFVMARQSLDNDDDALEAVQDAMLKLCEHYAERPQAEWRALFFRILRNAMMDRLRPRGLRRLMRWLPTQRGASGQTEAIDDPADAMDNLPGPLVGPQEELQRSDDSAQLQAAVSRLPEKQREVFLLRCWQELSVRETAVAMDISEGSVKTHLSRAIGNLRHQLQELST